MQINLKGNESAFNRAWTTALVRVGAVVLPVVGSAMQQPGWPDRYVAHLRWTGWIEGKAAGALSAAQKLRIEALWIRGVPAVVLRRNETNVTLQFPLPHSCKSAQERVFNVVINTDQNFAQSLLAALVKHTPDVAERWIEWAKSR